MLQQGPKAYMQSICSKSRSARILLFCCVQLVESTLVADSLSPSPRLCPWSSLCTQRWCPGQLLCDYSVALLSFGEGTLEPMPFCTCGVVVSSRYCFCCSTLLCICVTWGLVCSFVMQISVVRSPCFTGAIF